MKGVLLAIAAGLCWGIGELCTKSVLHSGRIGPLTAIAVRSAVALPAIWAAYLVAVYGLRSSSEPPGWWRAEPAVLWKLVIGSGLVAGAAAMICFYTAISLEPISRVKPIAFTIAPATAVILGYLLLHEPMSARRWIAVGLILLGVALLTGSPSTKAATHA